MEMLKCDESCQKSVGKYVPTHMYIECINIKKIRNWISIKNTHAQWAISIQKKKTHLHTYI